jgi:hypothetical protein
MNGVLKGEHTGRYGLPETGLKFRFCIGDTKPERGVQRGLPLAYGGLLKKVRNKLAVFSKPLSGQGAISALSILNYRIAGLYGLYTLYIRYGIYTIYSIYIRTGVFLRAFSVTFLNIPNTRKKPPRSGFEYLENFPPKHRERPIRAFAFKKRKSYRLPQAGCFEEVFYLTNS